MGCIYKWLNPDISPRTHISVGKVHRINEDGTFDIMYCPSSSNRKHELQLKKLKQPYTGPVPIVVTDSFALDYKVHSNTRNKRSRYISVIDANIPKTSLLQWNLAFTASGKFENRTRSDGHLGLTSFEVAQFAIEAFYGRKSSK